MVSEGRAESWEWRISTIVHKTSEFGENSFTKAIERNAIMFLNDLGTHYRKGRIRIKIRPK